MIPKIIHYCWFGNKEKPTIVKKCLKSWRTNLPDYKFIEWNETNFNIKVNIYVETAYKNKKFAFVSDFVRLYALFNYGGIYLDTDVEVFKKFDDLLQHQSFWGFEEGNYIATSTIGACKHNKTIRELLKAYDALEFKESNNITNVALITKFFQCKGLVLNGEFQYLNNIGTFFPQTYFSPYDYINCRKIMSSKTYAMHHFYKSWLPLKTRIKGYVKKSISIAIGGHNIYRIRKYLLEKHL